VAGFDYLQDNPACQFARILYVKMCHTLLRRGAGAVAAYPRCNVQVLLGAGGLIHIWRAWLCGGESRRAAMGSRAVQSLSPAPALIFKRDWAAVPIVIHTRTLMPSHLYQRAVLAWQCSVCRKIFCRSLDEVERECCTIAPPGYIEREFRLHNCVLVRVARQEKYDAD
jgi:hypothetical protein